VNYGGKMARPKTCQEELIQLADRKIHTLDFFENKGVLKKFSL